MMKISYQWIPGAYSYITAQYVAGIMGGSHTELIPYKNFNEVWKSVDSETIAVIPIENSRAGSIHDNLYNFMRYKHKIIGETHTSINHALLSKETDIHAIKKCYSHRQALSQCHGFLKKHHIEEIEYFDTAGAAQFVSESNESGIAAIASEEAGKLYKLDIVQKEIQDQKGNTTRFLIIADKDSNFHYSHPSGKTAILFQARDIPASLYKCLWSFATNNVNLTKIESIPLFEDPFMYVFWLEFEGKQTDESVRKSLNELSFFTKKIQILGEY